MTEMVVDFDRLVLAAKDVNMSETHIAMSIPVGLQGTYARV